MGLGDGEHDGQSEAGAAGRAAAGGVGAMEALAAIKSTKTDAGGRRSNSLNDGSTANAQGSSSKMLNALTAVIRAAARIELHKY